MAQPLSIIIVEKEGTLKTLSIKDFKLEELYKKCGFKKGDDFIKQVEWNAKLKYMPRRKVVLIPRINMISLRPLIASFFSEIVLFWLTQKKRMEVNHILI